MKKQIYILLSFLLSFSFTNAQIDISGVPISAGLVDVVYNTYDLPSIPMDNLMFQDLQNDQQKALPYRFAYNFYVSINPNDPVTPSNPWTWIPLSNGNGMWLIAIECSNALGLGLTFEEFRLDKGARMIIYNDDMSQVIGDLTHEDNNSANKLGTIPLSGDRIFLEIFLPANKTADVEIGSVACQYKEFEASNFAETCNFDAKCVIDGSIDDALKSVVRIISSDGSRASTGVLINSNSNTTRPYVITSSKGMNGDPSTWSFIFNYKSNYCESEEVSSFQMITGGAKVLKVSDKSDLMLLELFDTPTLDWNTHYNGWSRDTELPEEIYSVHQPHAGKSQFANSDHMELSTWKNKEAWKVENWSNGVMNPGSLGAPLFDENGLVTGFFVGGDIWCGMENEDKGDYFMPFHICWDEFKTYLDPKNISPFDLIGRDGNQGVKSQRIFNQKVAIFPTPADDYVYLVNENEESITGVHVHDAQGRFVEFIPFNDDDQRLDISHLDSGWYIFQVELTTFNTCHKVLVR